MAQLFNGDWKRSTDDKEKAEVLNFYFTSVFSQRIDYEFPNTCEGQVEGTGLQLGIDKRIVKEYPFILNEFTYSGPYELHPRILKELAEELSEPLSIIFLKSWEMSEVLEIGEGLMLSLCTKRAKGRNLGSIDLSD